MALRIFNTLTRTVEPFVPLDSAGREVRFYCCGPTVHNFAHIGNFRTFVFADLVRRHLEFKGYAVVHVMNITDVEDKIIAAARSAQVEFLEYTARYETAFFEDFDALRCARPHQVPRATGHIEAIIRLIGRLMERGLAYQASDGSIYFSIANYQKEGFRYGRLVNLNFEKMRAGDRVSADEYDKESVADFALWKARTPADGPVYWESPWGQGRPGWHIECSAMSMELLGPSFDLHLGGEDLIFPHHEDEIAQSEGAGLQEEGKPFVKYWLHGAHLLVEGKKMSKSLGNFFTLRDLFEKGFSGREIRYLLLTAHFREPFNFTLEGLHAGRSALERLDECLGKLKELAQGMAAEPARGLVEEFTAALDDDLNVSAAWGVIFEWVRETNRLLASSQFSREQAAAGLAAWEKINTVFAVAPDHEEAPPPECVALAEERQNARRTKDFKRADELREELKSQGWTVEDTPKGPRLKRVGR